MKPETLMEAGLTKNEAKVLSCFFAEDKPLLSRWIEHELRMRQPEVCTALIHFEKKGWLAHKQKTPKGKGRPSHLYRLKDKKELLAELINRLRKEQKKIEETINKLSVWGGDIEGF